MNLVLCQVKSYPLLEKNDGHIEQKFSPTTKFVPFLPFEDDEEATLLDEDHEILMYMEKINKYLTELLKVETI